VGIAAEIGDLGLTRVRHRACFRIIPYRSATLQRRVRWIFGGGSMMRTTVLSVLCSAALAVAACDHNGTRGARGHEGAPINLTGCLQKGDGMNTFVLTQVNTPTRSVGTSGANDAQPGAVAQEQMREAKHSYRLDGDKDELGKLVGKQVRVDGTVAANSDLNKRANDSRADNKAPDLGSGDLAKVDVKTIAAIADACGDRP
jgi:hypothetical protein